MKIIATTTGSYPPLPGDMPFESSIERAISDQVTAGLDLLSDGQVRSDIAGLFATKIPGIGKRAGRYPVDGKIEIPERPITLDDYMLATKLAPGLPVKAHLTGPTFLSQALDVTLSPYYQANNDPSLIIDLAKVMANEAKALTQAGAEYIQIDEPTFAYGGISKTGMDAIELIASEIKNPILHVCGDIRDIFDQLTNNSSIRILSVEGQFLRKLEEIDPRKLKRNNKKIAYGCIPVNKEKVARPQRLIREIVESIDLFGEENIWGITPNCGLRLVEYSKDAQESRLAYTIIERLALVAREVEKFISGRGVK